MSVGSSPEFCRTTGVLEPLLLLALEFEEAAPLRLLEFEEAVTVAFGMHGVLPVLNCGGVVEEW